MATRSLGLERVQVGFALPALAKSSFGNLSLDVRAYPHWSGPLPSPIVCQDLTDRLPAPGAAWPSPVGVNALRCCRLVTWLSPAVRVLLSPALVASAAAGLSFPSRRCRP